MLKATQDLPAVKKMVATAQEILGYDLLKARRDAETGRLCVRLRAGFVRGQSHRTCLLHSGVAAGAALAPPDAPPPVPFPPRRCASTARRPP